jgi:hypothetical protein
MRRLDVVFLFCVLGFAGFFAATSVTQTLPLLPGRSLSDSAGPGAAGQSRDVDMTKFKSLLDQGALSGHEAQFYHPLGASPHPSGGEGENSKKAETAAPLQ